MLTVLHPPKSAVDDCRQGMAYKTAASVKEEEEEDYIAIGGKGGEQAARGLASPESVLGHQVTIAHDSTHPESLAARQKPQKVPCQTFRPTPLLVMHLATTLSSCSMLAYA